jgi:creatinine amidohydrolase/Fe(II)-dependent formamide hydrolase-like protein
MPRPANPRLTPPARWRAGLALGVAGLAISTLFVEGPLTAPLSSAVEITDLTWLEVRTALEHGYTTVIVPSGGLEQNGPHMPIGKHDQIVRWTARRIASDLGRTLVAPVVSFVPEGAYDPPTGHMRYPGTIGVPENVFAATLEGIARSLKAAGFKTICFIADHGQSVEPQAEVAQRLDSAWRAEGVRVIDVSAYYGADEAQQAWLRSQGETPAAIGQHAGIQDTSELLAVRPEAVVLERFARAAGNTGVNGDPLRASAERGRALLAMKVDAAVKQIRDVAGIAPDVAKATGEGPRADPARAVFQADRKTP